MKNRNVVLLGIGHTNADVVHRWANDPIADCSLTCISKFPTSTYSGMLPGTLGGQFEEGEMRIDLRALAERAGAKLILAHTNGLDLVNGTLHFSDHDAIPFDALSIGVGSVPAGWQAHSGSSFVVPIKPMQTFLQRLDDQLASVGERGDGQLRVAIVGGGVASVEIAFCLSQLLRNRDAKNAVQIDIFSGRDRIADGMTSRSVAKLERLLVLQSIHIQSGQRVIDVGEGDLTTEDGCQHPTDCVIWATGAAAPPVLSRLGLPTDDRGFIATSDTLQSLADPRVFAVGDSGTSVKSPSPKAGVFAVRQCPVLWHNLNALLSGDGMQSFHPQSDFLKLLNTGDGKALMEYGRFTIHARWCWHLKTWIDRRFLAEFQG